MLLYQKIIHDFISKGYEVKKWEKGIIYDYIIYDKYDENPNKDANTFRKHTLNFMTRLYTEKHGRGGKVKRMSISEKTLISKTTQEKKHSRKIDNLKSLKELGIMDPKYIPSYMNSADQMEVMKKNHGNVTNAEISRFQKQFQLLSEGQKKNKTDTLVLKVRFLGYTVIDTYYFTIVTNIKPLINIYPLYRVITNQFPRL